MHVPDVRVCVYTTSMFSCRYLFRQRCAPAAWLTAAWFPHFPPFSILNRQTRPFKQLHGYVVHLNFTVKAKNMNARLNASWFHTHCLQHAALFEYWFYSVGQMSHLMHLSFLRQDWEMWGMWVFLDSRVLKLYVWKGSFSVWKLILVVHMV